MSDSLRQETLALYRRVDKTFTGYLAGFNQQAVIATEQWAARSGPWFLLLWGGSATGKSHLAQAALQVLDGTGAATMYVPLKMLKAYGVATIQGLEHIEAIAIDDVDIVIGDREWETALFALFNEIFDRGGRLFLTLSQNPRFLNFTLPDLESRLCSGLTYQLKELDDAQKQEFLTALANEHDIDMSGSVAEYIVSRYGRDLHTLGQLFERLDNASLQTGRHLTIPFVREILKSS